MVSQITDKLTVFSTVCARLKLCGDTQKLCITGPLWRESSHKGPVVEKCYPCHDVFMMGNTNRQRVQVISSVAHWLSILMHHITVHVHADTSLNTTVQKYALNCHIIICHTLSECHKIFSLSSHKNAVTFGNHPMEMPTQTAIRTSTDVDWCLYSLRRHHLIGILMVVRPS